MAQAQRPEGMGYFDFVVSEVHGLRIKELLGEKAAGKKVVGSFCVFVVTALSRCSSGWSIGFRPKTNPPITSAAGAQGWIGGDFDKFWWKNEGEAIFDGPDAWEMETDLLYSSLITPFWDFQIGAQYANEWHEDDSEDRWSGVIALQGLAPYKFELDHSLYVSEDGDFTFEFEAEYDLRITQGLVLQPRAEIGVAFQDVPERSLGAGMTDVTLDLRLRYEIKREFAPYVGVRSRFLAGETDNIAGARGEDTEQLFFMAGVRFAF